MEGFKVGYLTVISFSHKNGKGVSFWNVRCKCGNEIKSCTGELNRKRAKVRSCGCYKKSVEDISGKSFYYLTAIKLSHINKHKGYWLCKCVCGNEKIISCENLKRGHSKSCGCLVRKKGELLRKNNKERILNKVKINSNGCWEWVNSIETNRYGKCGGGYPDQLAHRASFILFKGNIPDGMYVCHHCDNPPCINPDHLFLGDAKSNALDASKKGRLVCLNNKSKASRGELNGNCKLNDDKVKYIRFICDLGFRKSEVASFFDVSLGQIKLISGRKSWTHI